MKRIIYTLAGLFVFAFSSFSQEEPPVQSCQAGFDWKVNYDIMLFAPGMAINFADASIGDADYWFWDFGDGSYSEEQNPMHIYTFLYGNADGTVSTGEFIPTVCLTIKTKDGCKSAVCKTLKLYNDTIIDPQPACPVYFYPYINDTIVSIPELATYSFKVSAPENAISWMWDFGDGTTSTDQFPLHSFDFMNNLYGYTVCLTVTTADGCINSYCSDVYRFLPPDTVIENTCQASFGYQVMESYPEQYAFMDQSMGDITEWFWDFGDGTYSSEQNPVHVFGKLRDSLDASGYLGPPIADGYKVCLTVLSGDNCKSTYCDYIYKGGVIDTTYTNPCPYYISVTTSNTLGGNFCNGTASANLVDAAGNSVEAIDYYWSTGEYGPSASGLCVNIPYYVSVTGADGCQLVGSFSILDYTKPIDPFGYWTIYGNDNYYDLSYVVPDSGYVCKWEFSDGTTLTGENVNYSFDADGERTVILNVLDDSGNVVYSEQIALNEATGITEKNSKTTRLWPNPATDVVYLKLSKDYSSDISVEIFNSVGQKQSAFSFASVYGGEEIQLPVTELKHGVYYARIMRSGSVPETLRFIK
jgi:hypothetical protein